ncbi:LADA_0B00760g1_1 [Lachancea dasiensis]|uniref:DNA replication ATP-dependent helicase/nuclease DNA2 n=1 Tax=Lachancea dasiensis TaxID=1072105 RepID=A0A1G4IRP7_9SACH|nr:LADA_0B00760g1_1 [Lachancea dasiensis]
MGSEELKKRKQSPFASPERGNRATVAGNKGTSSAVTSCSNSRTTNIKKRYKFAPLDTLCKKSKSLQDEGIMQNSLSISQVRQSRKRDNTAPPVIAFDCNGTKRAEEPQKRAEGALHELDAPEEVVWKYSPKKPQAFDGEQGFRSPSDDSLIEQAAKESSTPIVPNRYSRVLNFSHINAAHSRNDGTWPLESRESPLKQYPHPKNFNRPSSSRPSTRDIEEIINDIEGGFGLKPAFQNKDIPSSPTQMVSQRLLAKKESDELGRTNISSSSPVHLETRDQDIKGNDNEKDNDYESDDNNNDDHDDDDDDSLIDALTQKYGDAGELNKEGSSLNSVIKSSVEPHNNAASDGTCDDSLIEYLQETENTLRNRKPSVQESQVEAEIETVEKTFSQTFTVNEGASGAMGQDNEISEFIERAKFAVSRSDMRRLVILKSQIQTYDGNAQQKIVTCIDDVGAISKLIIRQPWFELDFKRGDVLHTIPGQNSTNKSLFSSDVDPLTLKMNDNLLILNPDILLPATTVGRAIECERRAIICNQISGPGEPSLPALVGSIVHELLQSCLRYKLDHQRLSDDFVTSTLTSLLKFYASDIIMCQTTTEALSRQIVNEHVPNVKSFIDQYVRSSHAKSTKARGHYKYTEPLTISNIIDIEENIWSPMYGLKGFIDATVEVQLPNNTRFISPLELKTGKTKAISHEAQGSIYTLLLNDRYELPVQFFLLFYTKSNDFRRHNAVLTSLKHLLVLRNRVTNYLTHELTEMTTLTSGKSELPPILGSSVCDNCYSKTECMVLNNLCDNGTAADSGLKEGEYDMLTGHLDQNHQRYRDFFTKYEGLIKKEESSLNGMNREVFLLDSTTRESLSGKCLSNLIIKQSDEHETSKTIQYTFIRKNDAANLPLMTNSQLSKNDIVIISDECGHFALCTGRVASISSQEVSIMTSRRLESNNIHTPGFEKNTNQTLKTVLMPTSRSNSVQQKSITYRIDRNEVQQGMALARFNLLNLFLPPISPGTTKMDEISGANLDLKASWGGDSKRRELIVDERPPQYVPGTLPPLIKFDETNTKNFNEDQRAAFEKVVRADDYVLLLGMPGTGKTTLIVDIVKTLVANGKTILLTSYTHSAIDNILIKLKNANVNIMRLGHKHRVHPEAQQFVTDLTGAETFQDLAEITDKAQVVATTCLNIHDTLLSIRRKDFDYVIVDEASQLSLPMCLGPLKFAPRFVLVGDHYQLPPLVKNDAARVGGLDASLFKILCDKHPNSVVELTHQYRMCQDIMTLSNYLIYNGKLKCGNDMVRDQTLDVPHPHVLDKWKRSGTSESWLQNVVDSTKKVMFLDHDSSDVFQEVAEKDNIKNYGEAEIVWQCVTAMVESGVQYKDIGVMTLYRAQLRLLRKLLNSEENSDLEILTADQFQGRDKQCIIISMVRSNDQLNGGSLLRELRRVNVAMTRAKSKLVIIGSRKTVSSVESLRGLMVLLEAQGWLYSLPRDCLECYDLPRPQMSQKLHPTEPKRAPRKNGNITANSKFVQDKPVVRDILNGM